MAKKSKDAIYDDFLADLKAINPAIEEIVKDEKVSAKLKESVLARADYSASMDALRTDREQFAAEVEEARQKIAGWQTWYGQVTSEVSNIQGKLKQYEQTYGDIEPEDKRKVARQLGISKEDLETALETRMNQRDLAALKFADDLTDIKIDFKDRFKEKLDTQAVFKIAGERQIDLNTAYTAFIADRVEEQRTQGQKELIAKERADAVAEYASQHNLPVVPNNSSMVHVLDAKDTPNTPQGRVAAALASLNKR